jgi:hypothetical protein
MRIRLNSFYFFLINETNALFKNNIIIYTVYKIKKRCVFLGHYLKITLFIFIFFCSETRLPVNYEIYPAKLVTGKVLGTVHDHPPVQNFFIAFLGNSKFLFYYSLWTKPQHRFYSVNWFSY